MIIGTRMIPAIFYQSKMTYIFNNLGYGKQIILQPYSKVLFPGLKECFKRKLKEMDKNS